MHIRSAAISRQKGSVIIAPAMHQATERGEGSTALPGVRYSITSASHAAATAECFSKSFMYLLEDQVLSEINMVPGQLSAYGLGVGVKQHLQHTAHHDLHLLAGYADYVAVGYGLFGKSRACPYAVLFHQRASV